MRPLCLGELDDRYVVASESCALDIIGAKLLREVQPGELVSLGERGIETRMAVESRPAGALRVRAHLLLAPRLELEGRTLQSVRGRMGEILAREAPVDADLVISVPDSGNAAAKGFARESGHPQDDGLIKNRYVARTFIQPGQELRRHGLRMKFNPLPEVVAGKRLVVVDDSIVRGNTMRQIVQHAARGGREEVHLRMSSPPIRHPCHYGVDMPTSEEMIAHGRTVDEVAAEVDADSLAYLSLDGRVRGCRLRARDALRRLLHGRLPARGRARGERQARPRRARPSASGPDGLGAASRSRCWSRAPAPTCRRSSTGCTGATASRWTWSSATARTRRALERAGRPGSRPRVFEAADYPSRGERDRAMAAFLKERGVRLVVLAGYMQLLDAAFIAEFPQARDQRPSGAAASLSRGPSGRGSGRLRRENQRCDGPFRG